MMFWIQILFGMVDRIGLDRIEDRKIILNDRREHMHASHMDVHASTMVIGRGWTYHFGLDLTLGMEASRRSTTIHTILLAISQPDCRS